MLAVIDYGAGNLRSVLHALNHLGADTMRIVQTPEELHGADKIILPGVGAFGAGMQQLDAKNLITPIQEMVRRGVPYLGICLGMQFLFERSDEMGDFAGLGLLPGDVTRFPAFPDLKVPHMGWNQLNVKSESAISRGIETGQYAYFVHSYYCRPTRANDVLFSVDYGIPFTAGVAHENIYGVQFHPEKSQQVGLQILRNFLAL